MTDLALDNVTVRIGSSVLIQDISLAIGAGEWLSIIGPNGAGKTTIMRAIAGMTAHSGQVTIGGQDSRHLTARNRALLLAYAPQLATVPLDMAVGAFVLLGRTPHLGYLARPGKSEGQKIASALKRLDIAELATRPMRSLSGGERQRAVLAQALVQETPILLMDEPTAALDIGHAQHLLELVDELRVTDGITVVTTMHDLNLAALFATSLALMSAGRLAASGPPEALLTTETITAHYGADVVVSSEGGSPSVRLVRSRETFLGPQSL